MDPAPPLDFEELVDPAPAAPEELPPLLLVLLPPFPALAELPPDEVLPPEADDDVETDPAVVDPPTADELADEPLLPAPPVDPPV